MQTQASGFRLELQEGTNVKATPRQCESGICCHESQSRKETKPHLPKAIFSFAPFRSAFLSSSKLNWETRQASKQSQQRKRVPRGRTPRTIPYDPLLVGKGPRFGWQRWAISD